MIKANRNIKQINEDLQANLPLYIKKTLLETRKNAKGIRNQAQNFLQKWQQNNEEESSDSNDYVIQIKGNRTLKKQIEVVDKIESEPMILTPTEPFVLNDTIQSSKGSLISMFI